MNSTIISIKLNFWIVLSALTLSIYSYSQDVPDKYWEKFVSLEDAGYSSELLQEAMSHYRETKGASLMVVCKGKVLLSEGDVTRKFMVHSIRKSFLNALYGIYSESGNIHLNSTLEELGIQERVELTDQEKEATIYHLLSSRSGIYLPAAYSPDDMEANLPARNKYRPGENWYYNNWDFNALGAIFNKTTGKDLFEEFNIHIASAIGMEDFRTTDCYYRLEEDKSDFPAYLFRMSARDMARFGLLYLNQGTWNGKQILPSSWIDKSFEKVSEDLGPRFQNKGSYGLLWWIDELDGHPMYYASGAGGHRIVIFPDHDMVIVNRTNTYENQGMSEEEIRNIMRMIINAKIHEPEDRTEFIPLMISKQMPKAMPINTKNFKKFEGDYKHQFLGIMKVRSDSEYMSLETNIGVFYLHPTPEGYFYPEDIQAPVLFREAADEEQEYTIEVVFDEDRNIDYINFYYSENLK